MFTRKRWLVAVSIFLAYFSVRGLYNHLDTRQKTGDDLKEEIRWVSTSNSWLDRMACRFFGVCGTGHFHTGRDGKKRKTKKQQEILEPTAAPPTQRPGANTDRILKDIPDFVLDFAPLVYLSEHEEFWPTDPSEHVNRVAPYLNYTALQTIIPSVYNLEQLNEYQGGKHVYLKSNDDPMDRPAWLTGEQNIPTPLTSTAGGHEESWAEWDARVEGKLDDDREAWIHAGLGDTKNVGGERPVPGQKDPVVPTTGAEGEALVPESTTSESSSTLKNRQINRSRGISGGKSSAPATLIVIDKGNGIMDAFWFYFYSYNHGNKVGGMHFGDHVGDWEHSLVRFHNGIPRAVFFSEHSGGQAYAYGAVEKIGKRPVIYAGAGTHALYAMPGIHPYVLPFGILHDITDKGPLWDPLHNFASYHYDYLADESSTDSLQPSSLNPKSPTSWFYFNGHWGDKFYGLDDKRQYRIAGQYHIVNGPVGPRFKNLGRKTVCYSKGSCTILESIAVGKKISWVG